jgi:hypothetical protein
MSMTTPALEQPIRRALCRDSRGNASGPLGATLDAIAEGGR